MLAFSLIMPKVTPRNEICTLYMHNITKKKIKSM